MHLHPVMCIVVPNNPPIDKYVAAKRVMLDLGDKYRFEMAFCDVNIPTAEHYATWEAKCTPGIKPYLIDLGDKKYHKSAGSAAEVEKMSSETESGRIYNFLVGLVNENNRSGKLKNARHSVAKIIRQAYHVMANGMYSRAVVFDHGMAVVNAFFYPQNRRNWQSLFDEPEHQDLLKLWEGFNVSEEEVLPFTLPMYFRQLFMSGRSPREITEAIRWWLDKVERIEKRSAEAEKKDPVLKYFRVRGRMGALAHINDPFETDVFLRRWLGSGRLALGIVRDGEGHILIVPSQKHSPANFKKLAAFLEKQEPGRWYFEERFKLGPILMNGSIQFTGVTPSGAFDQSIINKVRELVTFSK